MARLIVNPGTPQAWEIPLKEGANSIGRGDHNDFKIPDASVSDSHCEVFVQDGAIKIKDLGSTNGTHIDRSQVKEAMLAAGQRFHLGTVELIVSPDDGMSGEPQAATKPEGLRIAGKVPSPVTLHPTMPQASAPASSSAMRLQIPKPPPPTFESTSEPQSLPEPPRIAPPAFGAPSVCKFHPKSPGRWFCARCSKAYCDLCVNTRTTPGAASKVCRGCGSECGPLEIKVETAEYKSFFQLLPGAFVYPFKKEGLILLICATVFFVIVGFLKSFSFWLSIIFWGYTFAYMQNLIQSTANGDESPPSLPEISNFLSDILGAFLQLTGICIFCFAPAIFLTIWAFFDGPQLPWLVFASFALGSLYFPMAFLTVAMYDTVLAVNPMLVIPAIFKVPFQYLVVCIVWGAILAFGWFSKMMFDLFIPIPLAPAILSGFLSVYFLTMEMRMLGLFYFANKDRLGWFNR